MSRTNRVANRVLLALCALVLLAVAGVCALALIPATAGTVSDMADTASDTVIRLTGEVGDGVAYGALIALCAVVLVTGLTVAFARGGGRTSAALRAATPTGATAGGVTLSTAFVQDVLSQQMTGNKDIVGIDVSAWEQRRRSDGPALRVRIRPRRGVSPRVAVDAVAAPLAQLRHQLRSTLPVLVEVTSSTRARLAGPRPVD